MSQNPFSPQAQMEYQEPQRRRMSVLAVMSLIFSIICCIPGTGAIGTLLGTAALFRISRSEGRLRGTGLAVAGIILGLIVTAVYIGIAMAFAASIQVINADSAAVARAVEADDTKSVQSFFSPAAGAAVTDADVKAFHGAIDAKVGKFISTSDSLWEYFRWWTGPAGRGFGMSGGGRGQQNVLPHPVKYNGEIVVMVFEMDPMGGGGGGSSPIRGNLLNVGVIFNDGSKVDLVNRPAPGVVTPPAAPKPVTPPSAP